VRPPTRSRPSSTTTSAPARVRARAAARPDSPAPTTMTAIPTACQETYDVRHTPRAEVAVDGAHSRFVEQLVAARLVSIDGDTLQIAHEALVRVWPRLRGWLDDDLDGQRLFRHLAGAADAWETMGRPDSELYRGTRLSRTLEWQHSTTPDLNDTETAFLDASCPRPSSTPPRSGSRGSARWTVACAAPWAGSAYSSWWPWLPAAGHSPPSIVPRCGRRTPTSRSRPGWRPSFRTRGKARCSSSKATGHSSGSSPRRGRSSPRPIGQPSRPRARCHQTAPSWPPPTRPAACVSSTSTAWSGSAPTPAQNWDPTACTPRRRQFASVRPGRISLWDGHTGQYQASLPLPPLSAAVSIAYRPDSSGLVIAAADGRTWTADTRTSTWTERACRRAGRNLTEQEWKQFFPSRPYQITCPLPTHRQRQ